MAAPVSDEGKLSAWERWELASFDPQQPAVATPAAPAAVPVATGPTPEELDAIRRQARDEGYQAGYEQGQATAREEAKRLGRAADRLQQSLAELDQQVADELLALAMEIARQVVRREIAARPEAILDVVREALVQLPHQHAVIYLHPEDASLVRSYLGDSLAHSGHRLLEEPRLNRGDCLLEAGGSQLDATVATRWRRVLENLGLESAWIDTEAP
jgi:flagellar assembly protein FliH